jgi:hypothetical protein
MEQNLSSRQFFHGTSAKFAPGDLIHPNHLPDMTDNKGHRDFVWSTTSMRDAVWYAHHRANNKWHDSDASHIYEVEHTGLFNTADNPDQPGTKHRSSHVSLAPMRVKREVSQGEIDEQGLGKNGWGK